MATVSEKLRACGEGQESLRKIGVITEGPIHNINDNIRMAFAPDEMLGYRIMLVIADEIDAEERELKADAFLDGFRTALKGKDDERMEELGYIPLPKDADGIPIRIGDVLDHVSPVPNEHKPFKVEAIKFDGLGWFLKFESYGCWFTEHTIYRHYTCTVRDELEEMHNKLYEATRKIWASEVSVGTYNSEVEEIISEYAAKLQLREVE